MSISACLLQSPCFPRLLSDSLSCQPCFMCLMQETWSYLFLFSSQLLPVVKHKHIPQKSHLCPFSAKWRQWTVWNNCMELTTFLCQCTANRHHTGSGLSCSFLFWATSSTCLSSEAAGHSSYPRHRSNCILMRVINILLSEKDDPCLIFYLLPPPFPLPQTQSKSP